MAIDYTRGTGSGGVMLIRDHGANVEFFIMAGHPASYANQMPYNWTVNGSSGSGTIRYPSGGNWLHVATFNVVGTQDVKFGIGSTGTSGLGGPTDFWQRINRSTVPGPPSGVTIHYRTSTSVGATFSGGSDGGSGITQWEIGYGTDSNYPQYFVGSSGTSDIGGLAPGTVYYFWARGANANGWGGWGPRSETTTLSVPHPPSGVWFSSITGSSTVAQFAGYSDGGSAILEWQIGWGVDPNYPQNFVSTWGTSTISGLSSATGYYFWARGRNAIGWGGWGPRSTLWTAGVPAATSIVTVTNVEQQKVKTQFGGGADGGMAIIRWELGYGTDPTTPQTVITSNNGTDYPSNLEPGKTHYFWARGVNGVGNGPWSVRTTARTIAGARVLVGNVWKEAVPYVKVGGVWKVAKPYINVVGVWKETS